MLNVTSVGGGLHIGKWRARYISSTIVVFRSGYLNNTRLIWHIAMVGEDQSAGRFIT